MKTSYIRQNFHLFVFGVVIFSFFIVLINISLAQELNEPEDIYNKEKAIEIVSGSENGGPGGCKTEAACDTYCGSNQSACMDWALANGVISQENYDKYSGFSKQGGPGGCKTENECESYCDAENRFDECIAFAEKEGIISADDAARARKTGPGGCKTEKECRAFCENPQNQESCIDHAVSEGFMTQAEAQRVREFQKTADDFRKRAGEFRKRAREDFERPEVKEIDPGFDEEKAKELIETQGGPGGCSTFGECEAFCDNPSNQEACFAFAEENGLFRNAAEAEKIKRILKDGGPGGCRGEKECQNFCENEANFEVCIAFAEKEGFLPPEELERAKKGIKALKEGGPLGCKTKELCETVCQDPANQEVCFNWAKNNGLISEEEVKFMEEANKFREEFEKRRGEFESKSRRPDQFPGQTEFPGQRGEFPGRPREFPGQPPTGGFPPGQIPPGFEIQESEQKRQEFERHEGQQFGPPPGFEGQFQKPPEGFQPPPEGFQPPTNFQVPEGFQPPAGFESPQGTFTPSPSDFQQSPGTFTPPPGEFVPPPAEFTPPPSEPAPTTESQTLLQYSPFGVILKFFLGQ